MGSEALAKESKMLSTNPNWVAKFKEGTLGMTAMAMVVGLTSWLAPKTPDAPPPERTELARPDASGQAAMSANTRRHSEQEPVPTLTVAAEKVIVREGPVVFGEPMPDELGEISRGEVVTPRCEESGALGVVATNGELLIGFVQPDQGNFEPSPPLDLQDSTCPAPFSSEEFNAQGGRFGL